MPVTEGSVELPQGTVIAAGQLITGATASLNVIVWLHEDAFPAKSVAVQVRII